MTSRRAILRMAAGASLAHVGKALASSRDPAFPAVRNLDELSDLETFTRIRCSPPGTITTWWYSGHMLGRLDDRAAAVLVSVEGASQSRIRRLDDGSVEYALVEAGYYGDPETRSVANGPLPNPLSGEKMTPEHYLSTQLIRFTPDMRVLPARPIPESVNYAGRITPPDIKGRSVWMAEELFVTAPGRDGGPPRVANSLANFEADVTDVVAGGSFVPATFEFTTWNSWRPWMNMGHQRGGIMMRLNSIKLQSWQGIPRELATRIESDHPNEFDPA